MATTLVDRAWPNAAEEQTRVGDTPAARPPYCHSHM